jgi:ribonuclease Z
MDHFYGFDRLLRVCLGRNKTIRFFGPEGFLHHIEGKLQAYSWDLVGNYPLPFILVATEVGHGALRTRTYRCADAFQSHQETQTPWNGSLLWSEPRFEITCAILDHGIPCLAFALQERFHIHILPEELERLRLKPGPWLVDFKNAIYRNPASREDLSIPDPEAPSKSRTFRMDELSRRIAKVSDGMRIGYVTDAVYHPKNAENIRRIIEGADRLFIEAAFLEADAGLAFRKHHLTARQAGELAGQAGVRAFYLFHFSPRYAGRAKEIENEAQEAYRKALCHDILLPPDGNEDSPAS